jgi:hypothetical protein
MAIGVSFVSWIEKQNKAKSRFGLKEVGRKLKFIKMKRVILFIIALGLFSASFGQGGFTPQKADTKIKAELMQEDIQWETSVPKDCFCCNEKIYNLPTKAPITGPQSVSCGTKAVFNTIKCDGATTEWSISPSISGLTGEGTSTLTIPETAPAGSYTITLTIRCGKKIIKNQVKFTITEVKNCTSDFNYIVRQEGNVRWIETTPVMQTPGQEHWWGMQYNGTFPNCNPCASIPFNEFNKSKVWGGYINPSGVLSTYMGTGITTGPTPYGIKYTWPANSCVRVTHYVKCCGVLKRTTYCISISEGVNKMISKPNDENKVLDEVVNSVRD